MESRTDVVPVKAMADSKEAIGQQEDLEQPPTDKHGRIDHDAPVTEADIEFLENFKNSPAKAKLMRKMDFRLLPVLILLYLVSFIGQY